MDSSHLTPIQAARLLVSVRRKLGFLNTLVSRMRAKKFPEDDPVFVAADEARSSMATLEAELSEAGKRVGLRNDAWPLSSSDASNEVGTDMG